VSANNKSNQALKAKVKRIAKETIKDLAVASFAAFVYAALSYEKFINRRQNGYRR
jgi:hypothetical protein